MRFGVCAGYDKAEFLQKCGYDYIELSLFGVSAMSEAEFEACRDAVKKSGIATEVLNGFFPYDFAITGPDADRDMLDGYVDTAISRASVLGAKVLVLGSGRSRSIKDEWDKVQCCRQFSDLVHSIGTKAGKYGIKIAVEPLNPRETNFINLVSEGAEIARKVGLDNVGTMVDFYHFTQSGEDVSALKSAADKIYHVHLARGTDDRGVPDTSDTDTLKIWAKTLKTAGYNGRLSIEAAYKEFDKEIKNVRSLLDVFNGVDEK